jgi:hypothetical protein
MSFLTWAILGERILGHRVRLQHSDCSLGDASRKFFSAIESGKIDFLAETMAGV